jgi:hypothetical protein
MLGVPDEPKGHPHCVAAAVTCQRARTETALPGPARALGLAAGIEGCGSRGKLAVSNRRLGMLYDSQVRGLRSIPMSSIRNGAKHSDAFTKRSYAVPKTSVGANMRKYSGRPSILSVDCN